MLFKNFQEKTVYVCTPQGHTFFIEANATGDAPESMTEACLSAGLVPADKLGADADKDDSVKALEEAAKRSASAKKAAETRRRKQEAEAKARAKAKAE